MWRTDVVGPRVDERSRERRTRVQCGRTARVAYRRHAVRLGARAARAAQAELHERSGAARALQLRIS